MADHLAGESSWQDLVEDGCEGTSPVDASPRSLLASVSRI